MTDFCGKIGFFREGNLRSQGRERESVACGCRRGDVVARDDVIECKSLRYTVIEHFSHFPSRASVTSRFARSLARATVLSRRVKIEANISSRLFFRRGGAHSRGRTHVARQKTRFDAPFATLAEAAVKYRPTCRSTRTFTLNLRAIASVQGYQTRERRSSSAKVENRHGSLGNKMRAPALPWGWGPLDNPYCTPHPLVLPPYVRPSRRRP